MRALLLVGVAIAGLSSRADAAVIRYNVQGLFPDGETLSGSFFLDNGIPLPGSIYASTLAVSGHGTYGTFVGATPSAGSSLDIQFAGQGILDLSVTADYNSTLGVLYGIRDGALGVSALYGLGINDMFLKSGTINAVTEPVSMALLGTAVALTMATSRRRANVTPRVGG